MEQTIPDEEIPVEGQVVVRPRGRGESFTEFARGAEPRLLRALVAACGPDVGREATAEAIAYGWENWDRLRSMENPIGYLYRVGRTSGTPWLHRPTRLPDPPRSEPPWIEPALPAALSRLSRNQQTAVLLIKAHGLAYREVADLLGIGVSTVQKHVDRGLRKLRKELEVEAA
jgi:DNA-directed RNA polymerase specialized sigma24 family protein